MQTVQAIQVCKSIYRDATLSAAAKLDSMAGVLGLGEATRTRKPAASAPRQTTTTTPQRQRKPRAPAAAVTRAPRPAAASAPPATPFGEQVYALIPQTGGVAQTDIKLQNVRPNIIGTALSRLRKAGRLVEQNGVWFRAPPGQQQAQAA